MLVREIRVWTPATPVPCAGLRCGVINLRGTVLPIIDFAARLGFPPTEPTTRHAILVVQIGDQTIGLLVEGVSEILTISQDLIQPTPDVASQMAKDFVSGIVAIDGRMISLIALDAIMPATEQARHKCHLEHAGGIIWAYEPVEGSARDLTTEAIFDLDFSEAGLRF